MSCEPKFELVDPPMRGVPNPRYFKPLVRINAQTQDAPFNWMLDPCYLDMQAIASAIESLLADGDNQTLAFNPVTNQLAISGGNAVDISQVTAGVEPTLAVDQSIPTSVVGTDDYLLAKPTAWGKVRVGGVAYNIPLYS
jgi:hypothetical protein